MLPELASLASRVKVVILSASEKPERVRAAFRSGARAFVLKRYAVETLVEAIRAVAAGQHWIPAQFQSCVLESLNPLGEDVLTRRERQIIVGVCRGLKNCEVAKELFISEVTVKTHLNNIFRKLGVRDRIDLLLYASKTGLVEIPDTVL
jgi:DNA-binding NarL/FixJ family response regulator